MATSVEVPRPVDIATHSSQTYTGARVVPLSAPTLKMSAPANGDAMDVSSPTSSSTPGRPNGSETNGKTNESSKNQSANDQNSGSSSNSQMLAPPPAAAAVHQPKIVQTAFIHKLYKYEDILYYPSAAVAPDSLTEDIACSRIRTSNI